MTEKLLMKNIRRLSLVALASGLLLSACGGDGSGGSPAPAVAAPLPTSSWKMDAFLFPNGFNSETRSSIITGLQTTVAVVSSSSVNGVDDGNGAYSGSSLSFTFRGISPGTYNVVQDNATFIASSPANSPIVVTSMIGQGTTTGSNQYTASTGQVTVTKDSAGKFHFQSVSPLTTSKTVSSGGGVAGSPAFMMLDIKDAY